MSNGKILWPPELASTPLVDPQGTIWRVKEEQRRRFGVFPSRVQVLKELPDSLATNMEMRISSVVQRVFHAWLTEDVEPTLNKFTGDLGSIFDECVKIGQRTFRKELVSKLGAQGEILWSGILREQFDAIGAAWMEEQKEGFTLHTSGLLPPNTRFHWEHRFATSTYQMFCLEFPPHKRSITFQSANRKGQRVVQVAFPWLCVLVAFRNGDLSHFHPGGYENYRGFRGFWTFYRSATLEAEDAELAFPNFPNAHHEWPYSYCLGGGMPPVHLANPTWHNVLLDWFWNSTFGSYPGRWPLCKEVIAQVPEVATLNDWEKNSKKKPERFLTLPWPRFEQSLGEFAQSVLGHLASCDWETGKARAQRNNTSKELAARFRAKLEEELHFLGAHFSIPPAMAGEATRFVGTRLSQTLETLGEPLEQRCTSQAIEESFSLHSEVDTLTNTEK